MEVYQVLFEVGTFDSSYWTRTTQKKSCTGWI